MKEIILKIQKHFRPESPIDTSEKLVGRKVEVRELKISLFTQGRQSFVTGSRGIGKSSLINVISKEFCEETGAKLRLHRCSKYDKFESIFHTFIQNTQLNKNIVTTESSISKDKSGSINVKILEAGRSKNISTSEISNELLKRQISPSSVSDFFCDKEYLLVVDEFDRIEDEDVKTKIAETVRYFSDSRSNSHLIIAGINLSGRDFFNRHESSLRSTSLIDLQRIDDRELLKIINSGVEELGLEFDDFVKAAIIWISNGLPYYVHFICQQLAIGALIEDRPDLHFDNLVGILDGFSNSGAVQVARQSFLDATSVPPQGHNSPLYHYFGRAGQLMEEYDLKQFLEEIVFCFSCIDDGDQNKVSKALGMYKSLNGELAINLDEEDFEFVLKEFVQSSDLIIQKDQFYEFEDSFHKSFVRLKCLMYFLKKGRRDLIRPLNQDLAKI